MSFERQAGAIEAEVRRIGAFQLGAFRSLSPDDVHTKQDASGDPSVVTRYDIESEQMFIDWVRREFPGHGFVGEETGNHAGDPAHTWIVDPIDGTANFATGIATWGASVAYWRDGAPYFACVFLPALDQMFTATRGQGAFLNGRAIHASPVREYSWQTTVGLDSRAHTRHVLRLEARVRILGSAIANLCYTANGMFTASVTRGKLWDVAAGVLILAEAGAVIDSTPDLSTLSAATYAATNTATPSITMSARGNAHLPPLTGYLHRV